MSQEKDAFFAGERRKFARIVNSTPNAVSPQQMRELFAEVNRRDTELRRQLQAESQVVPTQIDPK